MTLNRTWAAAFAAVTMAVCGSANAAPAGALKSVGTVEQTQGVQKVDYRPYRHCHRRHGRKWCHGRSNYRRGYYGPGVSLYIGPRWGHRHRHRHHHHHHHHRRHHRH